MEKLKRLRNTENLFCTQRDNISKYQTGSNRNAYILATFKDTSPFIRNNVTIKQIDIHNRNIDRAIDDWRESFVMLLDKNDNVIFRTAQIAKEGTLSHHNPYNDMRRYLTWFH